MYTSRHCEVMMSSFFWAVKRAHAINRPRCSWEINGYVRKAHAELLFYQKCYNLSCCKLTVRTGKVGKQTPTQNLTIQDMETT